MLTYDGAGTCCTSCASGVVNGTLGSDDSLGETRSTVVVVIGVVHGVNIECAVGNVVVDNGIVSSLNSSCDNDSGTSVGANGAVSGSNISSASVVEISVLIFALGLFGNARDGDSVVGTRNGGCFSGDVVTVALVTSRVFTIYSAFTFVVVSFVTWTAAVVVATASRVLQKSTALLGSRTLVVCPFFLCAGSQVRLPRFP